MSDAPSLANFIETPNSEPEGSTVDSPNVETEGVAVASPDVTSDGSEAVSPDSTEPSWWYDEGIPGVGEPPDWYNKKTFPTLAAQAKNQPELRKKVSSFEGAPEGYEIKLGEDLADYEINSDDPVIKGLQEFAKEKNMPQDVFNEAVNMITKLSIDTEKQEEVQIKEYFRKEIDSLGSDGDKQVTDIIEWMKSSFDDFDLEKDQVLLNSAHAVRRLQSLKKKAEDRKRLPSSPTGRQAPTKSRAELNQMLLDPKYAKDRVYRKEVDDLWAANIPK